MTDLTADDRQFLESLSEELLEDRANRIWQRHVKRTVDWIAFCTESGKEATLSGLVRKLDAERPHRRMMMAAYAAALWEGATGEQ